MFASWRAGMKYRLVFITDTNSILDDINYSEPLFWINAMLIFVLVFLVSVKYLFFQKHQVIEIFSVIIMFVIILLFFLITMNLISILYVDINLGNFVFRSTPLSIMFAVFWCLIAIFSILYSFLAIAVEKNVDRMIKDKLNSEYF